MDEGDDKLAPTGILPGHSDSELLAMATESASILRDSAPDFSSVCLTNPGPFINDDESRRNPAYEAFAKQRDGQAAALAAVRDMWSRANAENAVLRECPSLRATHHMLILICSCFPRDAFRTNSVLP